MVPARAEISPRARRIEGGVYERSIARRHPGIGREVGAAQPETLSARETPERKAPRPSTAFFDVMIEPIRERHAVGHHALLALALADIQAG